MVDRLLPFDLNIGHTPCATIGQVDYISRQPNQKAKVTNQYDEEFAAETINRIHDDIAAIYIHSAHKNCQSQHNNAVNNAHCTRAPNT